MSLLPTTTADLELWAAESRAHCQDAEPHTFFWCVGRFWVNLDGARDPMLTAIARAVCERWAVWPEQLVARDAAGEALVNPEFPPPYGVGTNNSGSTCWVRHWSWWIARELTGYTYATIGQALGGRQAETVGRVVRQQHFFANLKPGVKEWVLCDEILPRIDRVLIEIEAQPRTSEFSFS